MKPKKLILALAVASLSLPGLAWANTPMAAAPSAGQWLQTADQEGGEEVFLEIDSTLEAVIEADGLGRLECRLRPRRQNQG
ncbi:MAG: hypothetical protein AB7E21_18110 [Pseudodonghicola sp.]|uniref:hypothetical protein n=1 Tax=Pseudodonghicola sp. TaxID=1969463 RepID=UPI003A97FF5F